MNSRVRCGTCALLDGGGALSGPHGSQVHQEWVGASSAVGPRVAACSRYWQARCRLYVGTSMVSQLCSFPDQPRPNREAGLLPAIRDTGLTHAWRHVHTGTPRASPCSLGQRE